MSQKAVCFRCKKAFRARKNQHPRYSFCPQCKQFRGEFSSGWFWVEHSLRLPKS